MYIIEYLLYLLLYICLICCGGSDELNDNDALYHWTLSSTTYEASSTQNLGSYPSRQLRRNKNNDKKKNKKTKPNEETSSPTETPHVIDLFSLSCSLFCDGIHKGCASPDNCCDEDTGFIPCDATDFVSASVLQSNKKKKKNKKKLSEDGTSYHCAKNTSYLGLCVEHDIAIRQIRGINTSQFQFVPLFC